MKLQDVDVKAIDLIYARELIDTVAPENAGRVNLDPLAAVCAELRILRENSEPIDEPEIDTGEAGPNQLARDLLASATEDNNRATELLKSIQVDLSGMVEEMLVVTVNLNGALAKQKQQDSERLERLRKLQQAEEVAARKIADFYKPIGGER